MGLDAFVNCNCLKEGRTAPFPCDCEIRDEDGYPELKRTEEMTDEVYRKLSHEVWVWSKDCCAHESMELSSERVGNWASIRFFQQVLEKIDEKLFPLLSSVIPEFNGGCVEAKLADQILRELDLFAQHIGECTEVALVEEPSGRVVYEYIVAYQGEFSWSKGDNQIIGVDPSGLFVKGYDDRLEVFRSFHFRQVIGERKERRSRKSLFKRSPQPEAQRERKHFILIDLSSGKQVEILGGIGNIEEETDFKVIQKRMTLDDFYVYEALTRLFQASKETGNPVVWC